MVQRHDIPTGNIKEPKFDDVNKMLQLHIQRILADAAQRDLASSGVTLGKIRDRCVDAVETRANVVWEELVKVLNAAKVLPWEELASDLKREVEQYLPPGVPDLTEILRITATNMGLAGTATAEDIIETDALLTARNCALARVATQIDLYILSLKESDKGKSSLSDPKQPAQHSPQVVRGVVDRGTKMWDIFICHASEDKDAIARPLADALAQVGLKVWYDEFTLTLGDSLRRAIDHGLAHSRYGAVILSPDFFAKEWPQRELDGLTAREIEGEKVILPIWHKVTREDIMRFSPPLADRLGVSTDKEFDTVVREILRVVRPEAVHKAVPGQVPKHETISGGPSLPGAERQPELIFKIEEIRVAYAGRSGGTNPTLYTRILVINRGQRDHSIFRFQISEEGGLDWQLTEEPFSPDGDKLKLPIKVLRDDTLFVCIRAQSPVTFEERKSSQVSRLKLKAQDHLDEQHELWLTEGPTSAEALQRRFGPKPTAMVQG